MRALLVTTVLLAACVYDLSRPPPADTAKSWDARLPDSHGARERLSDRAGSTSLVGWINNQGSKDNPLTCAGLGKGDLVAGGGAVCTIGGVLKALSLPLSAASFEANCPIMGVDTIWAGCTGLPLEVRELSIEKDNAAAECPQGMVVVGGGCACNGTGTVLESAPLNDGTLRYWSCKCMNLSVATARAVCSRDPLEVSINFKPCEGDYQLIGGGCYAGATAIQASFPEVSERRWSCSFGATAVTLCARRVKP